MTIPEAVQLVIRAGSLGEKSGQIFVLEMGEPVRIIDLAEAMIRLSGLEPERDIAVEIIGARPGEKFAEDLFNPYERPQPTPVQKILRAQRERFDPAWVERAFAEINLLVLEGDSAALADRVAKLAHVRSSEPLLIDAVPDNSVTSTIPGSPALDAGSAEDGLRGAT